MTVKDSSSPRRRIRGEKERFSGGLEGGFSQPWILRPLVPSGIQPPKRPCLRWLGRNETRPTAIAVGRVN